MAQVTNIYSSRLLDDDELSARHGGRIKSTVISEGHLFDPNIDVIDITSYPYQHADQVVAAKAGKHIIVEKPLTLASDLNRMTKAVKQASENMCLFEVLLSEFLTLKSVIDQGLVGKIHIWRGGLLSRCGTVVRSVSLERQEEAGGSSLLSAGYTMDALLYLMGNKDVVEVSSHSTKSKNRIFKYEYDTTSVTILKLEDGRLGKVASVIDCLQPYYFHTHLVGGEDGILDNNSTPARWVL